MYPYCLCDPDKLLRLSGSSFPHLCTVDQKISAVPLVLEFYYPVPNKSLCPALALPISSERLGHLLWLLQCSDSKDL